MSKIILVTGLFLLSLVVKAQDSLVLFTNLGCTYCNQTKDALKSKGITWFEYNLKQEGVRSIMLEAFATHDYHGTIFLPVILYNDSILHPVKISQTEMDRGDLDVIVNYIDKSWSGKRSYTPIDSVYVICKVFTDQESAKAFVLELREGGFSNSGFMHHNNKYRVYADVCTSRKEGLNKMNKMRAAYPLAHLLQPTKK